MAPKRARTAAGSSSASSSSQPANAAATKLTLYGGVPHHPSLAGLWREERLTDFAVCAEGVEFKAHRVALASSSKYFLNLFESGMRDAADATHALEGIRPKALEVLLAFIYEGKCEIDEGLLGEVLEASARLVVDALKEACADAIGARLVPSNALNVWRLADTFTLPALEKAAEEAALRGFEELPAQLATGAEVVALVQEDRLVAKSEEAVFKWCVRWWEARERPEAELLAVMKHVRFAAMAEGFLRETVVPWPALRSAEGLSMVLTAVLPAVGDTKTVPRSGFGPRLIYLVGGHGGGAISTAELYDPQVASWTQLAGMMESRYAHGCVALDGKLYAVGGIGAAYEALDTAEVYDPQADGWQPLAKMSTARYGLGLAAVVGKVYAIGGSDGSSSLDLVEAYDPQLGAWALVASMSENRRSHASVVLDGKIYAMGGDGGFGGGSLDTVEAYDPQIGSWQQVVSMPRGLAAHAAAAMGGKIYVTGGSYQLESVNSVYVYDPQADAWTQLASMSVARQHHASAAVGGKLYVFGGYGAGFVRLGTAEVYDPASDSWAQVSSLTAARSALMAVAL
jgi:N-acetylneuraminic acid mutarotase